MKKTCDNCKHQCNIKKWGYIHQCKLAKTKAGNCIVLYGRQGICKKHELIEGE